MKQTFVISLLLVFLITACTTKPTNEMKEKYTAEVLKVETDFAEMAKQNGIAAAFLAFADEEAVLSRGTLIRGKAEIKAYFEANVAVYKDLKLEWKPDFIEVSESGDLAYTYGNYSATSLAEDGSMKSDSGIFHTVWKRQADGQWKFVWD